MDPGLLRPGIPAGRPERLKRNFQFSMSGTPSAAPAPRTVRLIEELDAYSSISQLLATRAAFWPLRMTSRTIGSPKNTAHKFAVRRIISLDSPAVGLQSSCCGRGNVMANA